MDYWNSGILDNQVEKNTTSLHLLLLTHHSIFPLFQIGETNLFGFGGKQR